MTDLQDTLRLQAMAVLLSNPLPPVVKRKIFFEFLNILQIKFTEEELKILEETFKPKCCTLCGKPWNETTTLPTDTQIAYAPQLREGKAVAPQTSKGIHNLSKTNSRARCNYQVSPNLTAGYVYVTRGHATERFAIDDEGDWIDQVTDWIMCNLRTQFRYQLKNPP